MTFSSLLIPENTGLIPAIVLSAETSVFLLFLSETVSVFTPVILSVKSAVFNSIPSSIKSAVLRSGSLYILSNYLFIINAISFFLLFPTIISILQSFFSFCAPDCT